jgi:hypothetical protein
LGDKLIDRDVLQRILGRVIKPLADKPRRISVTAGQQKTNSLTEQSVGVCDIAAGHCPELWHTNWSSVRRPHLAATLGVSIR